MAALAVALTAGCASSGADGSAQSHGLLRVHIGLYGGPARPGGGMALSDSPAREVNVTAVDSAGRKHVATTDANGVATFALTAGRYTVFSTYCGIGPHHVTLSHSRTTRVQIACPVP